MRLNAEQTAAKMFLVVLLLISGDEVWLLHDLLDIR